MTKNDRKMGIVSFFNYGYSNLVYFSLLDLLTEFNGLNSFFGFILVFLGLKLVIFSGFSFLIPVFSKIFFRPTFFFLNLVIIGSKKII